MGENENKLFTLTRNLTVDNVNVNLQCLEDKFSTFFTKKIANKRNDINSDSLHDVNNIALNRIIIFCGAMLPKFWSASTDEVKGTSMEYSKSYDLDPAPTWLLKKCTDQLMLKMAIINRSMTESKLTKTLLLSAGFDHVILLRGESFPLSSSRRLHLG